MKLTRSGHRTVAVGATLAVISSIGVLGALPASAAPGDASATAVDIGLDATLLDIPVLDADAVVGSTTAPATVGTSSPTVTELDLDALGIVAGADLVDATATRGVGSSSASASVTGLDIDLLGIDAITAGVIASEVVCVAGETGEASTDVADLTVLGTAVPLASLVVNTPTAIAGVGVDVPGLTDASVDATVTRVEEESAAGARAAAIVVEFRVSVDAQGVVTAVPAGSVTIAEATCETPTAIPALTVSDIDPAEGPQSGGTPVTLTGTGFVPGATTVTFDGVAATDVVVADGDGDGVGESLTAVSPAGEVGEAVVVVGNTVDTAELGFTYLADGSDAAVATVAPTTGPTSGGTIVTITGSGLDGATGVTVDGEPGTAFEVDDAGTQITVTTPASDAAGPAPVVVQFPGGTASAGDFTYVAPDVWYVMPSQGPVAGGTEVEILGSGLDGATGVLFDGEPATSLSVIPGAVRVTTPAGTAGLVDVVVQLPGADAVVEDGFFYRAPGTAELLSLDPQAGETSGGTEVTITGTNLAGTTEVTFDGAPATIVAGPTETTVVVRTPAGDAGPADVAVTNAAGVSILPDGFTYLDDGAGAVVTGVEPGTLPTAGGIPVTVTGTDLDGAIGVVFDAVPGTDFVLSDDGTTITVLAPPSQDAGDVDVAIVFPGGQVPAGTVTYVAPTIGTLSPADGPVAGGTLVTIPGTGLDGTTQVLFDGVPGTELTVAPDGLSLTVRTPVGEAGAADVVVVQPGADATAPGGFTYRVVPAVASITPGSGPTAGGQTVLITGSGFEAGVTSVTFDGVPATDVQVLTPTILTAVTPAHDAGSVDVVVTVGTVASAPLAYLFDGAAAPVPPAPVITGVTPPVGSTGGGTSVVVSGENLVPGATSVVICGVLVPASAVTVDPSGTRAVFLTPPCAAGPQAFMVVTPGGMSAGTFGYMDVPVQTFPVGGSGTGPGTGAWGTPGGYLARTGAGLAPLVAMGLGLLLAGAAAAVVSRRQTQDGEV